MWVGPYRVVSHGDPARAVAADGDEVLVHLLDPAARHVHARAVQVLRRCPIPHLAEVLGADLSAVQPYIVTTLLEGVPLTAHPTPLPGDVLMQVARDVLGAVTACHAEGLTLGRLTPDAVWLDEGRAVVGLEAWLGAPTDPAADVLGWAQVVTYAAGGQLVPPLQDLVAKAATRPPAAHLLAELDGTTPPPPAADPYPAAPASAAPVMPVPFEGPLPARGPVRAPGLLLLVGAVLAPPLVAVFPVAGAAANLLAAALYGMATVAALPFTRPRRERRVAAIAAVVFGAPVIGILRALQQATFLALSTGAGILLSLAFPNGLQVETTLPRYTALAYALIGTTAAARKIRQDHKGAKGGFLVWLLTLLSALAAVALVAGIGLEPDWWPMTDDRFVGYVESCPELVRWACR